MLAFGVVFVLLLGEIDLSIGYLAGIGALIVAELQLAGSGHQLNGLLAMVIAVAACAAIGAFQGSIVAYVGVPSFVVTLAGFLIWQGVILNTLEQRGTIIIQDRWINYTDSYVFSPLGGWIIAAIVTLLYPLSVGVKLLRARGRDVARESWVGIVARTVGIGDRGVRHRRDLQSRQGDRDAARPAAVRRHHRGLLHLAHVPGEADDLRTPRLRGRRQRRGSAPRRDQRPAHPRARLRDLGRHRGGSAASSSPRR